jgi:hypothetical protein
VQIGYLQTWLLYHNALSAGVVIEDILKHARRTKERGAADGEDISSLRSQLIEQERVVKQLIASINSKNGEIHPTIETDEKTSLLQKSSLFDRSLNNIHKGYGATNALSQSIPITQPGILTHSNNNNGVNNSGNNNGNNNGNNCGSNNGISQSNHYDNGSDISVPIKLSNMASSPEANMVIH